MIGVDKRMDYCLPEGSVGRSVIDAAYAFHLEWYRQSLLHLGIYAFVELEQVRLPITIGIDTIRPSDTRLCTELLTIVDEVSRDGGF